MSVREVLEAVAEGRAYEASYTTGWHAAASEAQDRGLLDEHLHFTVDGWIEWATGGVNA